MLRRILKPCLAGLREGFAVGEVLTASDTGFPGAEECLVIRENVQPVLTTAKIEYRTIYYVGYFWGRRG